jgi:DNA mismatch repair protein MutL
MNRIKLLPAEVYSKIAAGEVIERPSSVVRELIDNSIDAGAKEIIIKIEKAGLKKISVVDDGSGIHKDDLALAFSMHATSKMKSIDDLSKIYSMGFRGEALHSIQTISKVIITSNTDNTGKLPGYKISNYGKKQFIPEPVAFNRGTKVEVEDIFYNLPARRKFLKSEISEWNSIKKTVISKALSLLDISFKLYHNDELIFATQGNNDFKNTFFLLYKNENSFEIYKYERKINSGLKLLLYHSSDDVFFQNRNYQNIFINSRPVFVNFFYPAIDSGTRNFISHGRYPFIYLYIDIDPSLIDVNIHPAKKEIKFINQNEIFTAIQSVIIEAFSAFRNRDISGLIEKTNDKDKLISKINQSEIRLCSEKNTNDYYVDYIKEVVEKSDDNILQSIDEKKEYKIIGTAFDAFILVQKDDKVLIIDQHAASEAILFHYKKEKYEKVSNSEKLLIPIVFDIENFADDLDVKIELINSKKFNIEKGEGDTIIVKEIPSVLLIKKNYEYATEIIKNYLGEFDLSSKKDPIDYILIEASCKEAIKKGDRLSLIEIAEIIDEYFKLNISNCPHGRPSHFELTLEGLQKIFQRKK